MKLEIYFPPFLFFLSILFPFSYDALNANNLIIIIFRDNLLFPLLLIEQLKSLLFSPEHLSISTSTINQSSANTSIMSSWRGTSSRH